MKHTVILYIVDRKVNDFMKILDLCHSNKVFVNLQEMNFTTTTLVDEDYFMNIIGESKKNENFWIAAISYMDNIFIDKDVKIISDGKQELFINI